MKPFESEHHVVVKIDGSLVRDEDEFHDQCNSVLGFPGFYGRNMNAWIDCMSYLDDPASGMTTLHVANGSMLVLQVDHARELKKCCPVLFEAIVECAAFVNWRRMEIGCEPILALSLNA